MKNKGFTLVELIAVIVIMGMLLLIVLPATSQLMRDNETRKYKNYYDIVKASVEKYARTQRDSIGGVSGNGCKDSDTLTNLINNELVAKFEDETITCRTPNEISSAELRDLGVDPNVEYDNIRIENKEGVISVSISMICTKRNRTRPVYVNLNNKSGMCSLYVPEVINSLFKKISDAGSSLYIASTRDPDGNNYVTGNPANNYVWYSGMMWRIVSYNTNEKTIKMVTTDNVSLATYNASSNEFRNSNMSVWLNTNFLSALKNPDKYLLDSEWNYTQTTATPTSAPAKTNFLVARVGLLNTFEYNKVAASVRNGKYFWLLSKGATGKAWVVNNSNSVVESAVTEFYGVRPSVVLRPNLTYISGVGTYANPYRLTGDVPANGGTLLNTRYAGEFVRLNNITYRIVSTNQNYTKLVAVDTLSISPSSELEFHFYDNVYSNNTYIGEYLHGDWKTPINAKLTEGDFCRMPITRTTFQTTACVDQDQNMISTSIAIPKIGDLFTIESNNQYWTLTNSTADKLYVVNTNGTVSEKTITEKAYVRPVIVVDGSVTIRNSNPGNGTSSSPYIIE